MKNKRTIRLLALVMSFAMVLTFLPVTAFAEESDSSVIDMIAGDSVIGFVPEGTEWSSSDNSVVWIDSNGSLNAMKAGSATVSVTENDIQKDYLVNVSGYSDGSEVVGNLKILARYNDSMQFYDGHVYLLFTSYQDGVTVTVPDLYAGYQISDSYYKDISEDISNGSNHTGSDAEKYFTFDDEMNSVTLDRGEIVTIGMYRDFDLSVPQAALGCLKNSSLWNELTAAGKAGVVETIFRMLCNGEMDAGIAIDNIKAILDEEGLDYNKLLDGVVDGGVCFNRELYNQKLEWDQYENVTYEMDITKNQLDTMEMYLSGNNGKFSILKNSCATVALRAWNATVGVRNGERTSYYLDPTGEGVFSLVDAPKTVRDGIVEKLPGYYLNNAQGVAEPDAGYQDDTGWVYVSAPEKVRPVILVHDDNTLFIDESRTKAADLINAAKGRAVVTYNKDEQDIDAVINKNTQGDFVTVDSIDFDINGTEITLDGENIPEDGVWFKVWIGDADNGEYYVVDGGNNALASAVEDGWFSFHTSSLPFSYKIVNDLDGVKNLLTVTKSGDAIDETEVYYYNGSDKVMIDVSAQLNSDTKIFVKPTLASEDDSHIATDITLNGESFFTAANYDTEEGAYFTYMPARYSTLNVEFDTATVEQTSEFFMQMTVGDVLKATDCAKLFVGEDNVESDRLKWKLFYAEKDAVSVDAEGLHADKAGETVVWLCAEDNENIGMMFYVEVYPADAEMAQITFSGDTAENITVVAELHGKRKLIPYSGYRVVSGSELYFIPEYTEEKAIFSAYCNNRWIDPGDTYTVTGDTDVKFKLVDATLEGMPEEIRLTDEDATYQLDASIKYGGIYSIVPLYDDTISYISSDELISVDENGLITVNGEIPEGGAVAYVTAVAGSSSDNVKATAKVIIGDYAGDKVVGRLTIHARRIDKGELIAHGCIAFTTYEDLDLDASYHDYYRPNDKYNDLMIDYEQHPENYASDPALYEMNELGLENRESYFDVDHNGPLSDPERISLLAGESFTVSNYGFDSSNIETVCRALKDSTLYQNSAECQALVYMMEQYMSQGENYDGALTFDALAATLIQIYTISRQTGYNPADGYSNGGLCINRELYNQFIRNDTQLPNNYYTVEITADELAVLKAYLADPDNNYYALMTKNCATGSVDLWNAVLADRPELQLKGNLTGVAVDPQSLYFDIGALTAKDLAVDLDGYGGTDFYPRSVRYSDATKDVINKIKDIGEVELTVECIEKIEEAREAYEALSDSEKERVWNYDTLLEAEEEIAKLLLEADKEAYDQYKDNIITAVDMLLADEDDSLICKMMISAAKAVINARPYDESMTLDENEEELDRYFMTLAYSLDDQRYRENPLLGDVDMDCEVTSVDATFIIRKACFMPTPISNSYVAGDVDGDGFITVFDATLVQRWLADMSSDYSIGQPMYQKD